MIKIGLDVDNVCLDFNKTFQRYIGKEVKDLVDEKAWKLEKRWGVSKDIVDKFFQEFSYSGMDHVYPAAQGLLIDLVYTEGVQVYYITNMSREDYIPNRIRNLKDLNYPPGLVICSKYKHHYINQLGITYFIDDKLSTVDKVKALCPECEAFFDPYTSPSYEALASSYTKTLPEFLLHIKNVLSWGSL